MGNAAELSHAGRSCGHARLEAGQGLPTGSLTRTPRPQSRCPMPGTGRMKLLPGPPVPKAGITPKAGTARC